MSAAQATSDRTTVEFPARAVYRRIGRLVLGGVASRFELPIDRVDDLLLAVDSLLLQETLGPVVRLDAEVTGAGAGLSVKVASFRPGILDDSALVRVLARLVQEVHERNDAEGSTVELVVSAAYRGQAA